MDHLILHHIFMILALTWFSVKIVTTSKDARFLSDLLAIKGGGGSPNFGCIACRHPCCFFTNCTKPECPTCHVKVPLCPSNCPCNIFTSDEPVPVPWEANETREI